MEKLQALFTLQGRVEKILFHRIDNGYTVLHLQPQDKNVEKVTVTGNFPAISSGQQIRVEGVWLNHPTHGRQFQATKSELLGTQISMDKFLAEYIDGIGPSTAKKLINYFGDELIDILDNSPEKLKNMPGFGKQKFTQVIASWQKQKPSFDIMFFLTQHGLHFGQATKVFKRYGIKTIEKVQEDPYRLIDDIDGVGFQTADNLGQKLGFAPDSPTRCQGGLLYLLQQAIKDGHCGMYQEKLLLKTQQLLNIPQDPIFQALIDLVQDKKVVRDTLKDEPCVFIVQLFQQEKMIAQKLKELMASKITVEKQKLEKLLDEIIQESNLPLSEEQNAAIFQALQAKVFVLTGGPGVGKTTLIKILTRVFLKQNLKFALAAPTGRAAKRISESTGFEAKTIHRLLEYDPFSMTFGFNENLHLPFNVIIIDECSMLDVPLCASIMRALNKNTRVIFVGDVDQLSAVGPGDVLKSLIAAKNIPFFALKTIFRQAASSQIIMNAHRVNQGLMVQIDKMSHRDFYMIRAQNPKEQQEKVLDIVTRQLPERFNLSVDDIQILTPMNKGDLGVENLNILLQQALNPPSQEQREIKHFGGLLRENDKVLQIVNNYEKNVFNGDVGNIQSINIPQSICTVIFDKTKVVYQLKELDQLRLAYAMSVHKSQGSEYPAVVIVLSMAQRIMLKRNLLYTAMTRGKSCVVIVSEPQAIQCAIERGEITQRISKLEEWLHQ